MRVRVLAWQKAFVTALALVIGAAGTANADLYGHWPLDDGEGGEARNLADPDTPGFIVDWDSLDSLGGTFDDPTIWVDDPVRGTVAGLNGQAQWIEAGFLSDVMSLENKHTWAFWGRLPPDQASPNNDIVLGNRWGENGSDTSPREFIKFTPNRFEYHIDGGFGEDLAYADSNMPLGQWIHNSVVKDGDQLSYYRNGEFRNSTTISGGQATDEPLPFVLGGDFGGGRAWRGSLSDVQLYTSALSPDQISTVMDGDLAAGADLYARYELNDGEDSDFAAGTGPGAFEEAFIENLDGGLGEDGFVWVDDPDRGTVMTFAGNWVDAGELPVMDQENDFTWNFWSNADKGQAQTSGNIIMGNQDGNGEYIKFSNNRIEFRADGSRASDLEWGQAGADDNRIPNDDNWYHHAVVKDGNKMTYYRDGQAKNEIALTLGQQTTEPLPFAMGGQAAPGADGGETPIVYLSDVRVYDNALSSAEVAALAGVELEPACDPNTGGDIDGNGTVEFADFLVLSNSFGQEVEGHAQGDLDCNGAVEFADFLVMSANFGQAVGTQSVPEPSGALLMAMLLPLLAVFRRRKRSN